MKRIALSVALFLAGYACGHFVRFPVSISSDRNTEAVAFIRTHHCDAPEYRPSHSEAWQPGGALEWHWEFQTVAGSTVVTCDGRAMEFSGDAR